MNRDRSSASLSSIISSGQSALGIVKSLNYQNRKSEIQRITVANQLMAQRLINNQSFLDRNQLKDDFK